LFFQTLCISVMVASEHQIPQWGKSLWRARATYQLVKRFQPNIAIPEGEQSTRDIAESEDGRHSSRFVHRDDSL
jgi:hypothetical protein